MPIYEYACPKCGEFEVTQRITEDALKKCPTCKSKVRKLISNTSFQLKGSGWYATDYAGKGKKDATKDAGADGAAKSADGESKGSSDTSGESKSKESTAPKKDAGAKKDTSAKAA